VATAQDCCVERVAAVVEAQVPIGQTAVDRVPGLVGVAVVGVRHPLFDVLDDETDFVVIPGRDVAETSLATTSAGTAK